MTLSRQQPTAFNAFRQFITELLIVLLLLKAFVPLGYMPDMQALADGVVRITICTASGTESVLLDSHKNKRHAPSQNSFCPFGWSQTQYGNIITAIALQLTPVFILETPQRSFELMAFYFRPQQARAPPHR